MVRRAVMGDVPAIHPLIDHHAQRDRMLFRSTVDLYEHLRDFSVFVQDGRILGCCALELTWSDLAEVKSLAVDPDSAGRGIGRALVEAAVRDAAELGITRVFALTREAAFFAKLGFHQVRRDSLPHKVWRDCFRCPKQDECDEVAVIRHVTPGT